MDEMLAAFLQREKLRAGFSRGYPARSSEACPGCHTASGPLRRKSVTKEPTTDLLLGKAMKAVARAYESTQLMTNA